MAGVSPWIEAHGALVPVGGRVLDVACGTGPNTVWFVERGHPVTAVDRDIGRLGAWADDPSVEAIGADLESGAVPFSGRTFAGVVVTKYLHRPLFPDLLQAVAPGGALLYETFAHGQEGFGRPTNPAYLLAPGELLAVVEGVLQVVAFEDVVVDLGGTDHRQAALQRIAAVRPAPSS